MFQFTFKRIAGARYQSRLCLFQQAVLLLSIPFLLCSCVDTRKLAYFPGQNDTSFTQLIQPPEQVIQANDVLSITVSSLDPTASAIINQTNLQATGVSSSQLGTQTGYLVSTDGYVQMPFLGKVKAAGFTKPQLSQQIATAFLTEKILKDPIITIRQLNYHITLVGEVGRPGVYNIPSEKVNLLEALGQGGDLTPYANRKTVVLIREENGERIFRRIDLNSSKILTSPYYYLKSNDIVYAESNKTRAIAVSNQSQFIGYGLSAISILITIFVLLFRR